MLAEFALAAARRAERALGPGAAVAIVSATLETTEGEARRTLLLAGLGAAARAGDTGAFASFARQWAGTGGDASERRGLSLIARLEANGGADLAARLARAEVDRHRSADALFVLAAIAEREGASERAVELWRESSERATRPDVGARSERAALRHAPPERAEEAEAALTASRDARDVPRLASAALGSSRLYARVRTLDRLLALADDPTLGTAVLRVALAHADLRGPALGALERDRIAAIAARARAPARIIDALSGRAASAIDEAAARDALLGIAARSDDANRSDTLALRAIAAVATEASSASLLLSALAAHPPSPAGWTAVLSGLADPRSRPAATACADRWIECGVAPPRGFSVLASTLDRAGNAALAERALVQAVRANERGARRSLGASLERRAHVSYAAGDRAGAKALLERSLIIDPDDDT